MKKIIGFIIALNILSADDEKYPPINMDHEIPEQFIPLQSMPTVFTLDDIRTTSLGVQLADMWNEINRLNKKNVELETKLRVLQEAYILHTHEYFLTSSTGKSAKAKTTNPVQVSQIETLRVWQRRSQEAQNTIVNHQ